MINSIIENKIKIKTRGYILDPITIFRDFRIENSEIEGYHGRELLELLQNAVDELEGATDRCVCVELKGNILRFSNNGTPFSEEGIISLMYSHLSPKYKKHKYIGNKGTGFRSVLNWSECVRIYSGELSIEFSKKQADELLCELIKNQSVSEYQIANPDLGVATLVAPKIIEPLFEKDFDTVIEIEVRADMLDDVSKQISQINERTLLFLNYLEHLIIKHNDEVIEYKKFINSGPDEVQTISLVTIKDSLEKFDEWVVAEKHDTKDGQEYFVTIAFKEDMSVKPDVLYSYFKTKVSFPIPALVHGTFDLDANRNHLNETSLNIFVLQEACGLIIDVAESICKKELNFAALKLLALRADFPLELNWARLDDFYLDAVMKRKVLPNVNSEYISFSENPKFYKSNLADFLEGDKLNQLLIYSDDSTVDDFIDKLAKRFKTNLKYDYEYITVAINSALPKMDMLERAACCAEFLTEYQNDIKNSQFPHFILDADGIPVTNGQIVFIPPETADDTFPQPPKYAQVAYLFKPLLKALRDEIKHDDLRDLSSKLSKFNVREYNLTEIVRSVLSKLKKRRHQDSKKTINHCSETVLWLFKLWETNKLQAISGHLQTITSIPVISRDGMVSDANDLYLGSDYGNVITDNLFLEQDQLFVSSPKSYSIDESNLQSFIEFLLFIGISKFPRIKHEEQIFPTDDYKNTILSKIFPLKAEDNYYLNFEEFMIKRVYIEKAKVSIIEHYERILSAPTKCILEWLRSDLDAQRYVVAEFETNPKCSVYLREGYQQKSREVHDRIASFMRFEFSRKLWIDFGDERYSPIQCLFVKGIETRLLPLIIEPDLDAFIETPFKRMSDISSIKDLLLRIGASDDFAALPVTTLYQILLKLPEADVTGEISKHLYRVVVNAHGLSEAYKNNHFYNEFMQKGMVFCKYNKGYVPINQAYYLTERTVSGEVIRDFNIIAIPNRLSQDTIKEYFGVESLKLKGKIVGSPVLHACDRIFCEGWSNFKVYAFCYRIDIAKTPEISSVKSLKVRLCSEIIADYGKGSVHLGNYSFLKGNKEVYLKVPGDKATFDQLRADMDFCAAIAEVFVSTIDIQDETLYSRLRSLFGHRDSERQKMILQDNDDINILTRTKEILEHTQTKKEMFLTTCEQFGGTLIVDKLRPEIILLNFDDINCVENGEKLVSILDILNVDVNDFNNSSEFLLDLHPYYYFIYEQLRERFKKEYKNWLYCSMINSPLTVMETFLHKYNEYCDYTPDIKNSTKFDALGYFNGKWGLPLENISLDADTEWGKYRGIFIERKEIDVVNLLLSNLNSDSLLYFGRTEELEKRYLETLEKWRNQDSIQNNIRDATTVPEATTQIIEVSAPSVSNSPKDRPSSSSTSRSVGFTRPRSNEDWGAFAERIVYEDLKRKFTEVLWVSENAKKHGINSEGRAGFGYDMQYSDENGKTIFVEVKSSSGTAITFHITENELLFAERHAGNYKIAFVTNIEDTDNLMVNFIDKLFLYLENENRFENRRFRLTADNYIIRCEERKT